MSAMDALLDALESELQKCRTSTDVHARVAVYNRMVQLAADFVQMPHPALSVQLVPSQSVSANDYNPNRVAPPEMRSLKFSIQKDGVTMPIVVAKDTEHSDCYIVVDGFHRTEVIKNNQKITNSLAGYLPVVPLNKNLADRISATERHNMARGNHQVELSVKMVKQLQAFGWSDTRIGNELGKDPDELLRLKQSGGFAATFVNESFGRAWVPVDSVGSTNI
jgi:ParB-like chromosome segregation protein Spo0J